MNRQKPQLLRTHSLEELKAAHSNAGTKRKRRALPALFAQIAAERRGRSLSED